jgi:hypothetical protein
MTYEKYAKNWGENEVLIRDILKAKVKAPTSCRK